MISGSTEYPCIGVSENTFVHTSYFNMHDSSSPPAVPVQMQEAFQMPYKSVSTLDHYTYHLRFVGLMEVKVRPLQPFMR